jgi:demethoxyubiquinone hydroxylase (CLK1/Coq7/Cat5 family)
VIDLDRASMIRQGQTRRELVRDGAATGALALALAASAVPSLLGPPNALAASGGALVNPGGDDAVLASVLRVEQVVVFAYERTLTTATLSASVQEALTTFLDQERAHVRELSLDLTALGGTVPGAVTAMKAFEAELRQLRVRRRPARLRTEREYLRFLVDLETVIARHYRFAIELLTGETRLWAAAEIMADEAQHATVLSELLSPGKVRRAVPSAFVAGIS